MRRRDFLGSAPGLAAFGGGMQAQTQDANPASAQAGAARRKAMTRDELLARALDGCNWLADRCQAPDRKDPNYGAMRSEYIEATRQWRFYQLDYQEPFWHTGQAVRTLLVAYNLSRNPKYLEHAVRGGEYLIHAQNLDKADERYYGFIFSKNAKGAATASQLEGFCALLDLFQATGDEKWRERLKLGLDWLLRNLYRKGEGLFTNTFLPREYGFAPPDRSRPFLDDATLYWAYREFKQPVYLETFREVADRLLRDEDPPGNWINYAPCQPGAFGGLGQIHPRQTWWWGYPMLTAYDAFRDDKYLKAGARATDWYIENSSLDGACYYHNTRNGKHLSFDFCVSAVGCATVMYVDMWKRSRQEKYRAAAERALGFLLKAQFGKDAPDPDMRGAFFEGLHPPDGSGRQRFYLRDISTAFASRAMLEILQGFDGPQLFYQEF